MIFWGTLTKKRPLFRQGIVCVQLHYSQQEDRDDGHWADVADKEPEDAEDLYVGAKGTAVGEFFVDISLLKTPAHKEDCKETSEGHQNVRREIVEEIEDGISEDADIREWTE